MKVKVIVPIIILYVMIFTNFYYSTVDVYGEFQVLVKVLDYHGRPLPNAFVRIKVNDTSYESKTNENGIAAFSDVAFDPSQPYVIEVYYRDICVANETKQGLSPEIRANVYDISVFTWDLLNRTVNPTLRVRSLIGSYYNETQVKYGHVTLTRVPLDYSKGTKYVFTVIWQGVVTDNIVIMLTGNNATQPIILHCSILDMRIEIRGIEGGLLPSTTTIGNVELPGVQVEIRHPNGTNIVINSSSILLSKIPCGKYVIQVRWWGVQLLSKEISLDKTTEQPISIYVNVFTAKFVITDAKGGIFANTNVTLRLPIGVETSLFTNENGEIVLSGLMEGQYTFKIKWKGIEYEKYVMIHAPGVFDVRFPLVDITLRIVTRGGGEIPLSNARVELYVIYRGSEILYDYGITDDNGYVEFVRVPQGEVKIRVIWNGIEVAETILNTKEELSKTIKCDLYSARITIMSGSGRYLINAKVKLTYPNGTSKIFTSNEVGEVDFGLLPPGKYKISVTWKNVDVASTDFILPYPTSSSGDYEYTIKCEVYDLKVRVINSLNKPLNGAKVVISSPTGIIEECYVRGGIAEFKDLPYGDYTLDVYYLNKRTTRRVTVGAGLLSYEIRLDVLFAIDGYAFSLRETILLGIGITGFAIALVILAKVIASKIISLRRRPKRRKKKVELFVPFRPEGGRS